MELKAEIEADLDQREAVLMLVMGDIIEKRWEQIESVGDNLETLPDQHLNMVYRACLEAYSEGSKSLGSVNLEKYRERMIQLAAAVCQAVETLDMQIAANSGGA